jgi:hypothetical protein
VAQLYPRALGSLFVASYDSQGPPPLLSRRFSSHDLATDPTENEASKKPCVVARYQYRSGRQTNYSGTQHTSHNTLRYVITATFMYCNFLLDARSFVMRVVFRPKKINTYPNKLCKTSYSVLRVAVSEEELQKSSYGYLSTAFI